jgi:hypothetical protein
MTARAPAWLSLVDGRWQLIRSAAKTVCLIYRWATEGHGQGVITKKLNAKGVPVIGRGKHWAKSYVTKLLNNRAVIGEFQPMKGRGKKRAADGKPISGYYPALLTEDDWYAARAAVTARKGKVGRLAKDRVNVFAGLLYDACDGGSLQIVNKGKKGSRSLVPYQALQGVKGSRYVSFPFDVFERALLSQLREIKPADIVPKKDSETQKTEALIGRLAHVDAEIEKLKTRLQARYSDAVADVLERHEGNRKKLAEKLSQAHQQAASPLREALGEWRSLIDVLDKDKDARVRLRATLRRIVEGVWCVFVRQGSMRLAEVQVWFKRGDVDKGAYRSYLVLYRPATGGAVGVRPPRTWVGSIRQPDGIRAGLPFNTEDLRDPDQADCVRGFLEDYPRAMIDRLLAKGT